jgi:hypothetical protein
MRQLLVLLSLCLLSVACSTSSEKKDDVHAPDVLAGDILAADAQTDDTSLMDDVSDTVEPTDVTATELPDDASSPDETGEDAGDLPAGDVQEGPIPATPAGEQLAWLLSLFNDTGYVKAEGIEEHFSAAFLGTTSPSGYSYALNQTISAVGTVELLGFEESATTNETLVAKTYSEKLNVYMYLGIRVEATSPNMIEHWMLAYAPVLDDAVGGALGADEMGVFVYDPYQGTNVMGATVEAVHRDSGESFDPPVIGTTGPDYPWVRLTLPEGVSTVALRITEENGYVTRFYSPRLTAGIWRAEAPAFPAEAPAAYLEKLELAGDPAKSHLWGFVSFTSDVTAEDPSEMVLADNESPWVGCATIDITGAEATPMYSEPEMGWPVPEAEHTSPDYSTWWAFNVANSPLSITATAADGSVTDEIPILEVGGVTVLETYFTAPEFTTNPTGDDCTE